MSAPFGRILVLGARGMLGTDMVERLRDRGDPGSAAGSGDAGSGASGTSAPGERRPEILAADIDDFDLTDRDTVLRRVGELNPDLVINCAAYTNVDGAETERDAALAVNRDAAGHAAEAAAAAGAALFHISTDFIFDGRKRTPYREDDPAGPASVYGISKWEGEERVRALHPGPVVIRTSWLYGPNGKNFVKTILRLARSRDVLSVVEDQEGRPTYSRDLASWIADLAADPPPAGAVHAANDGQCSWFGFARRIVELAGMSGRVRVVPTTAAAFGAPAPRPAYSVLALDRLAGLIERRPRPWDEALKEYVETYEK